MSGRKSSASASSSRHRPRDGRDRDGDGACGGAAASASRRSACSARDAVKDTAPELFAALDEVCLVGKVSRFNFVIPADKDVKAILKASGAARTKMLRTLFLNRGRRAFDPAKLAKGDVVETGVGGVTHTVKDVRAGADGVRVAFEDGLEVDFGVFARPGDLFSDSPAAIAGLGVAAAGSPLPGGSGGAEGGSRRARGGGSDIVAAAMGGGRRRSRRGKARGGDESVSSAAVKAKLISVFVRSDIPDSLSDRALGDKGAPAARAAAILRGADVFMGDFGETVVGALDDTADGQSLRALNPTAVVLFFYVYNVFNVNEGGLLPAEGLVDVVDKVRARGVGGGAEGAEGARAYCRAVCELREALQSLDSVDEGEDVNAMVYGALAEPAGALFGGSFPSNAVLGALLAGAHVQLQAERIAAGDAPSSLTLLAAVRTLLTDCRDRLAGKIEFREGVEYPFYIPPGRGGVVVALMLLATAAAVRVPGAEGAGVELDSSAIASALVPAGETEVFAGSFLPGVYGPMR